MTDMSLGTTTLDDAVSQHDLDYPSAGSVPARIGIGATSTTEPGLAASLVTDWFQDVWHHPQRQSRSYGPVVMFASFEQVGTPSDVMISASPWPALWRIFEDYETAGIVAPQPRRPVLFKKEVSFRIKDLPRWRPSAFFLGPSSEE